MQSYESSLLEGRPRLVRIGLVLVAGIGAASSVLLFRSLRSHELESASHAFELDAAARLGRVQQELRAGEGCLRSIEALFAASTEVEVEELRAFVATSLEHPALRAVLTIVSVERPGLLDPCEVQFRAGPEAELVPTDPETLPEVAVAIARCRESGRQVTSAPFSLSDDTGLRVLALVPIVNRHRERRGLVGALWAPEAWIGEGEGGAAALVRIEDVTSPDPVLVAGPRVDASAADDWRVEVLHELGGRRWRISGQPAGPLRADASTWVPLGALLLGLLTTGLLVAAVVTTTGRVRLHRLVASRTEEVRKAYGTLADEAKERQWAVAETRELERQLRKLIDVAPGMVYVKDWFGRFLLANRATADAYGTSVAALSASREVDLNTDVIEPDEELRADRELMQTGLPGVLPATSFVDAQGRRRILRVVKIPCAFGQLGQGLLCIATDITDQEFAEDILSSQNRILASLAQGTDPAQVLAELVAAVEGIVPDMRCSVLLLGEDRRLHHGCAPHLPPFFNEAVDGIEIGAHVGSCGAAAYGGERVIVDDVMSHENWAPYRDLALRADIAACWSEPIRGSQGELLGTFAMYYRKVRAPQPYEEKLIESMAHLAGLAIERGNLQLVRT